MAKKVAPPRKMAKKTLRVKAHHKLPGPKKQGLPIQLDAPTLPPAPVVRLRTVSQLAMPEGATTPRRAAPLALANANRGSSTDSSTHTGSSDSVTHEASPIIGGALSATVDVPTRGRQPYRTTSSILE